jgi:hypothetical protein
MVISADEKKVLLERLQKARETKAAKAAAKKKETLADVKEPEPPAPAPVVAPPPAPAPAPAPEPVEKPAPSEPIDIPQVPDLVAASKKRAPAKKKKVESSDDDSEDEAVLPPKKGKGKKQAYMKIKIYKEPKNTAAFQSLIEAVQDEEPEEDTEGHRPPTPPPPASASIGRSCRFANANANNPAMKKGAGVISAQELMRRAAMEFFS